MGAEPRWAGLSDLVQAIRDVEDIRPILDVLDDSMKHAAADDDSLGAAVTNFVLGEILEQEGRYQDALSHYENGLQALAKGDADVAVDVGYLLDRIQGFEKSFMGSAQTPESLDLYSGRANSRKLASLPRSQAEKTLAAALSVNAGNLYLTQDQMQPAKEYFEQAIASAAESGDRIIQAQARSNLAWSAIRSGRNDEAAESLRLALAIFDEAGQRTQLRKAVLAVGVNARESGNLSMAARQLRTAIELYQQADDDIGYGRALAHLGSTLLLQEKHAAARTAYLSALEVAARTNDDETARHGHGGLARTYQALGNVHQAANEYEQYFASLGVFLSRWKTDQGRVGILENQRIMLDGYALVASDIARQTGDYRRMRDVMQKVRGSALACLLQSKQNRPPHHAGTADGGAVLYGEEWDYVQMEYAGAINTETAMMMATQMTEDVELDTDETTSELVDHCAIPDSVSTPRADAPIMLEYYVGPDRLVVLLVTGDEITGKVVDIRSDRLVALIDSYVKAIRVDRPRGIGIAAAVADDAERTDKSASLARELYDALIEPVEDRLPKTVGARVVFVPDDALWRLPFAALVDANGRYLGDRYRTSYITSQAALQLLSSKPRQSNHKNVSAWVIGNPTMPAQLHACGRKFQLTSLPGAEEEAYAVEKILGAKNTELFVGGAADRLRLDAWHGDYSVVHLATHGVACPSDPLSSFIAMADLKSQDLQITDDMTRASLAIDPRLGVQLDLKFDPAHIGQPPTPAYPGSLTARHVIQKYAMRADLVTLSACQSGLGHLSGEGMIGFARAFLAAGTRSLIVSLWKVDDAATRALMTSFYRHYAEHGDKGRALQKAMTEVRAQYPDPRHWAGFVLLGLQE
jgi:CHAT domain-containing protein